MQREIVCIDCNAFRKDVHGFVWSVFLLALEFIYFFAACFLRRFELMGDGDMQPAVTFEQAAQGMKSGPKLSNEQQLALYGWYKQATEGDNTKSQPSRFKAVDRYKWDKSPEFFLVLG